MKREIITIGENGSVQVPATPVWMSACEIADLLGAFSGKVNAQIKAIFKVGLLMETEVMRTIRSEQGFIDLYSIEMITMLSFRIATPEAKTLRRWIIGRLLEKKVSSPPMIVCYTIGGRYC
jgi:lipoprotein